MKAPVTQSEWAKRTAKTTPPAASETPATRNKRSQVSAAGEKIGPMDRTGNHEEAPFSNQGRDAKFLSGSRNFGLRDRLEMPGPRLATPDRRYARPIASERCRAIGCRS